MVESLRSQISINLKKPLTFSDPYNGSLIGKHRKVVVKRVVLLYVNSLSALLSNYSVLLPVFVKEFFSYGKAPNPITVHSL
jgi:hypothetical protein